MSDRTKPVLRDHLESYQVTRPCPGVHFYIAQISLVLTNRSTGREMLINASGTDTKESGSIVKCQMELLERFASCMPMSLPVDSTASLEGLKCLPWPEFAPYDNVSISKMEMSCMRADQYCLGYGLGSACRYAVSATAVAPSIHVARFAGDSKPDIDGSGLAAGLSGARKAIVSRALCEVVERDTMMLSWRVNGWPTRPLGEMISPEIRKIANALSLRIVAFDITGPTGLPTVIAMAFENGGFKLTCGTSCHPLASRAVEKAALEALSIRATAEHAVARGIVDYNVATSLDHIAYGYINGPLILDWYWRQSSHGRNMPYRGVEVSLSTYDHEPIAVRFLGGGLYSEEYEVYRVLVPRACRKEWQHERAFFDCPRLRHFLTVHGPGLNRSPHPFG